MAPLDPAALAQLETDVARALRSGDDSALTVLGHGEISLVLGWPGREPVVAAKRLPPFASRGRAEAYGVLVSEYLDALGSRGVRPVETRFLLTPSGPGPAVVAYLVQPILDARSIAPAAVRRLAAEGDRDGALALLSEVVATVVTAVGGSVGLDGQLSNWGVAPDGLVYFDVTTPLLADERGATRLDLDVLTSSLPAALRPPVRRWVAPGIAARYHRPRDVLLDLAANLLKERLAEWVGPVVGLANEHVAPAITVEEVQCYYRDDARLWEVLLRLRKADRWWQRHLRRRPYPSLLPRDTDR